jgi:hypothetical protein
MPKIDAGDSGRPTLGECIDTVYILPLFEVRAASFAAAIGKCRLILPFAIITRIHKYQLNRRVSFEREVSGRDPGNHLNSRPPRSNIFSMRGETPVNLGTPPSAFNFFFSINSSPRKRASMA